MTGQTGKPIQTGQLLLGQTSLLIVMGFRWLKICNYCYYEVVYVVNDVRVMNSYKAKY